MNWFRKHLERLILWALGYSYLPSLEKKTESVINLQPVMELQKEAEEPKAIFIPYHDIRVPRKSSRR